MKKLFKYLKSFKGSIVLVMILIFLQTLSELLLPTLMAEIVNKGIVYNDIDYIIDTGKIMLFVALIGTSCAIIAGYLASKTGMGLGRKLRYSVFTKVEEFSLNEFDDKGTASLITRTTNDITQVQTFTMTVLKMFIRAPFMAIGAIIMAFSKDVNLSFMLLGVILIIATIVALIARKTIPLYKQVQTKLDKLNLVLRERLMGIRVIRAFRREKYEKDKFHDANIDLTDTSIKVNKIMAVLMPMMMFAFNITAVAIIWFGSKRVDVGSMEVGDLMAFIQYAMQIMFSLIMLTMMFVMVPKASASVSRINEILDLETDIKDPKQFESTNMNGYLEFENVSFKYHNAEEFAIEDISFSAKPGEVTALIGSTGSGKSTLVNLIPRFYDVAEGSIKVDGIDIRKMKQETLRKKIGLVPQQAILFTGSIIDNIKYGKSDASEIEVHQASNISQASEFIDNLPEQYEAFVTQGGTNLSGGQKQRLTIARALVRKPEIYLFDDSFSALDFKTAAKLRSALKEETKDATVLIIAQRVTSIMDADRIIVLEKGKIVGMGKHKELFETCEVYKEIIMSQLSEEEIS